LLPDRDILLDETGEGRRRTADGMVCIACCSSSALVSRSFSAADASMSTREYFSSWRCISMRTLVASLFPIERLIRESAWTPNDRLEERTFADTAVGLALS
jgi:hypothetical protein